MNHDSRRIAFEKRWQSRFEEFAALRDDDAGIAGWSESGLQARFRFFISLWRGTDAGALYVDAGCGAGTYSRWLADQGLRVIGVDYSLPALVKAKSRDKSDIRYCVADASRLPFPDNSADGLLCFGVLQAVWESEPFVQEAARILKPGGEFWIDALNAYGLRAAWDITGRRIRGKPMHLRYESPRRLTRLLLEAGFSNLSRYWLPILPSRFRQFQSVCEHRVTQSILQAILPFGALASHSFLIRATFTPSARSSER